VWIPGGTPHAVRMVGAVQTRSVLLTPHPDLAPETGCRVVSVSPLLRQLLVTAADLPTFMTKWGATVW
jgi:hypothetical protein